MIEWNVGDFAMCIKNVEWGNPFVPGSIGPKLYEVYEVIDVKPAINPYTGEKTIALRFNGFANNYYGAEYFTKLDPLEPTHDDLEIIAFLKTPNEVLPLPC